MINVIFRRLIHTTRSSFSAGNKSLLATLRNKTGYTFSNCKKALALHDNDVSKAEDWLHAQAKAEGWAKIGKLKGRATKEGLIGLVNSNNIATMVEVNCETDFVARNENFQSMVSSVALSTLAFVNNSGFNGNGFRKTIIGKSDLSNLKTIDNEHNIADLIALNVNLLGENISLGRAVCVSVDDEMLISGYTHPPVLRQDNVMIGKFGSLICYKKLAEPSLSEEMTLTDIGRLLAKQIVGMNPQTIGNKDEDKPSDDPESETRLIFQSTIDDAELTIGELIEQNGVQIIDFIRFQCGETID